MERWVVNLHRRDDYFGQTFYRTTPERLVDIERDNAGMGPIKWIYRISIYPYKKGIRGGWDGSGNVL